MDKSLAPLIVVVAIVVVLTIVVINLDTDVKRSRRKLQKTREPRIELSSRQNRPEPPPVVFRGREDDGPLLDVEKQLAEAQRFLATGKLDKAEDALRTILIFKPDNQRALTLLGGILFYSRRYAEAELLIRRQVRLAPKNHQAYNKLGSVLAKQRKFKEAIRNASMAVGLNPDSGEAQINLAGMYAAVGKDKQALEHLRKAVRLLGRAVLPLTEDEVFDSLRELPEFQEMVSNALADKRMTGDRKKRTP